MKNFLLIISCLLISSLVLAQSSLGVGSGIMLNKTISSLDGIHTTVEIIEKTPTYSGQLFYEYEFSEKYTQEVRASYKTTSYNQNIHSGDYAGSYDTSSVSTKSIDFINLHRVKIFKKLPIYAQFGVNFSRIIEYKKTSRGHYYNYGPGGNSNDSTNYLQPWNYSTQSNPKTWQFGFSLGLMYSKNITNHLKLRVEVLFSQQLNAFNTLNNVYSRTFQFNTGISYSLDNHKNQEPKKIDSQINNAKPKAKKNKSNLLNFGITYTTPSNSWGNYNFHLNYLRQLKKTKIYVGLGLIKKIDFDEYFFHLAFEYRPLKFISLGFYPGLHRGCNYSDKNLKPTFDFSLNLQFPIGDFEIGPFTQLRMLPCTSGLNSGLKIRFVF